MTTTPPPGPLSSAAPTGAQGTGTTGVENDPDAPDLGPEVDVVPTYSLLARVSAEAFGTFVLVLLGVGTALFASVNGVAAGIGVPLGFGIGLLGAASAVGHISGGHFNPAVTLGAAIARRVSWGDLVPYWFAQIVGGVGAALVLWLLVPPTLPGVFAGAGILTSDSVSELFATTANGYGVHSPLAGLTNGASQFGLAQAVLVEIVATAIFVGVILGVTDKRVNLSYAPAAIGLTLAVLLMFAAPMTNGSLNPARSTAAAVFSSGWALGQLWVFWAAPLLGGAIAALIYRVATPQPALAGAWPQETIELAPEHDGEAVGVLTSPAGGTQHPRQPERHALAAEVDEDEIDALLARRAAASPAAGPATGETGEAPEAPEASTAPESAATEAGAPEAPGAQATEAPRPDSEGPEAPRN